MLEECQLCAYNCKVNRNHFLGACQCGIMPKLALASIHRWEEPCISGSNGSGTVFFSGCNLRCQFCQNFEISENHFGKEISIERLTDIFLELQNKNVHNINLVSPTPYVPQIIQAIDIAKKNGLHLPIVYNTNSYENVETIKMLNGYVDIYLPDLKYFDDNISIKYSKAPNYFEVASRNILEMYRQVGSASFQNGIMQKGMIIRHLILPGQIIQTKRILNWIKESLPQDSYISIMAQYFPTHHAKNFPEINRKISKQEYNFVVSMLKDFENGFIQELSDSEEEYVPNFNLEGV
ncbi:MAG: radical SAM protein [Clostridia bacterium]|nr:radical SAM protein [Clostridia bacterium]